MTNRLGYLAGNRPGFTNGTDSDTGPDTDSLTDSSHVRAIAARPVPSLPIPSKPNPGAIPHNRDQQLNGEQRLSAVDAEVATAREAPAMTRAQAMATAQRMAEGEWQIKEIQTYLAGRGHAMSWETIKRWADPEWGARRRAQQREQQRRWWRDRHGVTRFGVLDGDARSRLAEQLDGPILPETEMTEDLMLALRTEDGLSYTAIAKVACRFYGLKLSAGQVRDRLNKRGVPKNPAKVRSAEKLNAAKGSA